MVFINSSKPKNLFLQTVHSREKSILLKSSPPIAIYIPDGQRFLLCEGFPHREDPWHQLTFLKVNDDG